VSRTHVSRTAVDLAVHAHRMHDEEMMAIQIRDVPDDVRDRLAQRARANGQSLQAFLREVLLREATFTHNLTLLDAAAARRKGSSATGQDVLDALDEARGERPGGST
jgi:antitoxin FitA